MEDRYRILCIGETWLGANARAAFMALRRLGHSIQVIDEHLYSPAPWQALPLRIARRLLRPLLVRELFATARQVTDTFRPQAILVYKGNAVHPDLIRFYKSQGIAVVNIYPDVSFRVHGPYIPRALPCYDHVFTTKSWGVKDMKLQLGLKKVSYLEHGFDPELHRPSVLCASDRASYECDVVFVGTWSPKKEQYLAYLKTALPDVNLRIWGSYWKQCSSEALRSSIVGVPIHGDEYPKVLQAAKISLGLLSEARRGASSGDLTTSRTFNIPACGAFLLHERNAEALKYFAENEEAGYFDAPTELADKVRYYLENAALREKIRQQGRARCLSSGYSIDGRMKRLMELVKSKISHGTRCATNHA